MSDQLLGSELLDSPNLSLADWIKERHRNALVFAEQRPSRERKGWVVRALYLHRCHEAIMVCDQLLEIMAVYHEQENSADGLGTPGGLEHMGDVWKLFHRWEKKLMDAKK